MAKLSFSDQYKHPKWQEKRLDVLNENKKLHGYIVCERCFDGESQIHVHHKRYIKGRMIWEYETPELEVLCESCHELTHIEKDQLQEFISRYCSEATPEFFSLLVGYSSKVNGPAGWPAFDDYFPQNNNPRTEIVGSIAGVLQNRLSIHDLNRLLHNLEETKSGEEFIFKISKNVVFTGGGECATTQK